MKFKIKIFILFPFILLLLFLLVYTFIWPKVLDFSIANNYYTKKMEFNTLRSFLGQNDSVVFRKGTLYIDKDINSTDKIKRHFTDSLYLLLGNINCENIYKFNNTKDSTKSYLLIYHTGILSLPHVYIISAGNKKPLKEMITPHDFYNYHWLDNNTLAGRLK